MTPTLLVAAPVRDRAPRPALRPAAPPALVEQRRALLREVPFRMELLQPPYAVPQPVPVDRLAAAPAPGSVLAISILSPARDGDAVSRYLPRLRAAFPSIPFIALLNPASHQDSLRFACRAGALRLRAVLVEGEPPRQTLAPILCDHAAVCENVVEWLSLRRLSLSPTLAFLVHQLFLLAPRHRTVALLLRELGESETSTRFRFRKKRLPSPQRWHQAARALHAAMQIQASPDDCLLPLALRLGYGSDTALARQMRQVFGLRPAAVRGTLGWEWLMDRWLDSWEEARESRAAAG